MSKATTKEVRAILETASELFDETGCVPGIDGEEVRAETMVPNAKEYTSESIENPEVLCDLETWDRPGFTLVLSWLAQKWLQKCHKLVPRGGQQHLTKEQQKACLDSAAAELIRDYAGTVIELARKTVLTPPQPGSLDFIDLSVASVAPTKVQLKPKSAQNTCPCRGAVSPRGRKIRLN